MPFLYQIKDMDVNIKKIDSLNAILTVKITNEDYNAPYEASLKTHTMYW